VEARFSAPFQTGSGAHPASYKMSTGSYLGVKRQGRGVDHPPPSSVEVKEIVWLYLFSRLELRGLFKSDLHFCLYFTLPPVDAAVVLLFPLMFCLFYCFFLSFFLFPVFLLPFSFPLFLCLCYFLLYVSVYFFPLCYVPVSFLHYITF
jgi:hypothetical protein